MLPRRNGAGARHRTQAGRCELRVRPHTLTAPRCLCCCSRRRRSGPASTSTLATAPVSCTGANTGVCTDPYQPDQFTDRKTALAGRLRFKFTICASPWRRLWVSLSGRCRRLEPLHLGLFFGTVARRLFRVGVLRSVNACSATGPSENIVSARHIAGLRPDLIAAQPRLGEKLEALAIRCGGYFFMSDAWSGHSHVDAMAAAFRAYEPVVPFGNGHIGLVTLCHLGGIGFHPVLT